MEVTILSIKESREGGFLYGIYEDVNYKVVGNFSENDFREVLEKFDFNTLQDGVFYFINYDLLNIVFYGSYDSVLKIRKEIEDLILLE